MEQLYTWEGDSVSKEMGAWGDKSEKSRKKKKLEKQNQNHSRGHGGKREFFRETQAFLVSITEKHKGAGWSLETLERLAGVSSP